MGYKLKSKSLSYFIWLLFDPVRNQPVKSSDGSLTIESEQLYDLEKDSHENLNLANSSTYENTLKEMRRELISRIIRI